MGRQLRPGQRQEAQINVGQAQIQPRQAQQRQPEFGERQAGPVDTKIQRAQPRQVEAGQRGDAQVHEREGPDRQVNLGQVQVRREPTQVEGVEVERQVVQAQFQVHHQRRHAVGLGQRRLAHLQRAREPGLAVDLGHDHAALQALQRQLGATWGRTQRQRRVRVEGRQHPTLLWLALFDGHLLAADAKAPAQLVTHPAEGQAQVQVGRDREEVVVLGRAVVEGKGTDLRVHGTPRGVEAQVRAADRRHVQALQRATIVLRQIKAAQAQHAGNTGGRQHEAAVDATGRKLGPARGQYETAVVDGHLDRIIASGGDGNGDVA